MTGKVKSVLNEVFGSRSGISHHIGLIKSIISFCTIGSANIMRRFFDFSVTCSMTLPVWLGLKRSPIISGCFPGIPHAHVIKKLPNSGATTILPGTVTNRSDPIRRFIEMLEFC